MALPDLTTLDAVKTFAGVTSPTTDAVLAQLITGASAFIRTWINRDITAAAYAITRSGRGEAALLLPEYPVTAVSSVQVDGQPIPAAGSFQDNGYRFDDTQIVLTGFRFSRGAANVTIHFTAGFDTVPADIALACAELVTLKFRTRDKLEVSSKTLAGETVSFTQRDMPAAVATVLRQYQRIAPL